MKKEIIPSVILTIVCIILLAGVYPAIVWGIAQLAPNKGEGFVIKGKDNKYFYANIGQNFSEDKYFSSRPSAVGYNAAGSGGSNKGPDNPDYLLQVQARIDTFMIHNPGINKGDIPSDLVTASGSGLDPHISVQGAKIQIKRIAKMRGMAEAQIASLINAHIEAPMYGLGPERINVLKLNIALDGSLSK
jgi:K+-transporting ATPase ATPase C chain